MKRVSIQFACYTLIASSLVTIGCGGGSRYRVPDANPETQKRPTRVMVFPFEDNREYVRNAAALSSAPPLSFSVKYKFSRPDEAFSGAVKPFPQLLPSQVAKDLSDTGYFDQVFFAGADEVIEPGTYDLALQGTLNEAQSRGVAYTYGLVLPLGLSMYDVAWFVGLPKFSRRYDFNVSYQWYDGYTNEPVGEPILIDYTSTAKQFTTYTNESKMEDLGVKFRQATKELVDATDIMLPKPQERYWAEMRESGMVYLAELERRQQQIERGTPPTFTLLTPVENAVIRSVQTPVQWSVAAPNGLKSIEITLNGQPLQTGVTPVSIRTEQTAPRSIPARENTVALNLGVNQLRAVVTDWRNNTTEETLTVMRYPTALTPESRNALILAADLTTQRSATNLKNVLIDPFAGQFSQQDVQLETNLSTANDLRSAVSNFSGNIVSGELAVIHLLGKANTANNSIVLSGGEMPLQDFMALCAESLATDEVIIVLDLDWNAEGSTKVLDSIPEMPNRWALVAASQFPRPTIKNNGGFVYTESLASSLKDSKSEGRLSLERLFDIISVDVEIDSESKMKPEVRGRYNPNILMATYE
ncbi:MAG: hypothetical protein ACFCU1_08095 [Sumerlaeia bacterium]